MTLTADFTTSIPDLSDAATFAPGVPHDAFDAIRNLPGWYWQPTKAGTPHGGFWAVTRNADIVEVEKETSLFSNNYGTSFPGQTTLYQDPDLDSVNDNITLADPPTHTALRRVGTKAFGPRIVAQFNPWITETISDLLDKIDPLDELDLVHELAEPIPAMVISRIMGVPKEHTPKVVSFSLALVDALNANDVPAMISLSVEQAAFLNESVWAEKLRNPADDMTTTLVHAHERGEITRNQADIFLAVLIGAGFETTHTAIAQALRMILEDEEILDKMLRAIPEVGMDRVVTEFLRLIAPVMHMTRTALSDAEFCGQHIQKGDTLLLFYTAANRDPAVFGDPHTFDPWRPEVGALTFGTGPHRCIGFALAKLEISILLEQLNSRGIRYRLNGEPRRGNSVFINQLTSLPVTRVRG